MLAALTRSSLIFFVVFLVAIAVLLIFLSYKLFMHGDKFLSEICAIIGASIIAALGFGFIKNALNYEPEYTCTTVIIREELPDGSTKSTITCEEKLE